MEVRIKEPMSRHTTFRAGGEADWYVLPENVAELKSTISELLESGTPYYIVGNGSNLLVSDKGYRGVIIGMERFCSINVDNRTIRAGSGALLSRIAKEALKNGLTGLEFASGIPGSLGGAVSMNAGAYGSEIRDVIDSATVLTKDGRVMILEKEELGLSYRRSVISEKDYVVLEASFTLPQGDPEEIKVRMDELAAKRKDKQPLEFPSAGSTFKRPEGYFAGKLIEDAGLKGFSIGGAQVSEKHAGFVINRGQATASELYRLFQEIRKRVSDQSGVQLELEVKLLGDFSD